ncbi:ATP-binding protein [Gemmatimonas sp.]|jgi:signal transduction histidine kinase|uniref:ATP-binding protein n=1 Tax=Gemmatimonas sp. TaxID=1962908 RepID=UPI0037BF08FD
MPNGLSPRLTDPARLATLRDATSPRTYPVSAYDALTRVAATALDVPVVLVSLVDDKGQFFQGMTGLLGEIATCRSTPLSHAFCRHVVESGAVLRIVDSRVHLLVSDNPVIEALGVVGYLGFPLTTSTGHCLGALCAIAHTPRDWTPADETTLRDLSRVVINDLELRAELTYRERADSGRDLSLYAEGLPARAEDLLEQLHEGAAAIDRQWRLTYVNDVGARALQLDRGTAIGQLIWEAIPSLPESPFERVLREVAAGRQPLELEAFVATAGRWFDVRAVPARHGLSVYFNDTTERRNTIEALQVREAQLRQAQKLEAIGSLAGGIAHDFNNLLTVIRANTELLLDDMSGDDERVVDLQEIQSAATRAAALTQQLLAFGRKQQVQRRPVDAAATMLSLTPMLRRLIPSSVEMESRCPPNLPKVLMDAGQLEQVVVNLAVNARDAMPNGGHLRLHVSARELYVPTRDGGVEVSAGRWVTLTVQDTGEGIPPNALARIFEPFFTTKDVGKGTGLGLATVFRIVDDAGGVIAVESRAGQGTRFCIYLPALAPDLDCPEERQDTRPTPRFVRRVEQ